MQGETHELRKQAADIALELAERESTAQAALVAERTAHEATKADLQSAVENGQIHMAARTQAEKALADAKQGHAKAIEDLQAQHSTALQDAQQKFQESNTKLQDELKNAAAKNDELQAAGTDLSNRLSALHGELAQFKNSTTWKEQRAGLLRRTIAQADAAKAELATFEPAAEPK